MKCCRERNKCKLCVAMSGLYGGWREYQNSKLENGFSFDLPFMSKGLQAFVAGAIFVSNMSQIFDNKYQKLLLGPSGRTP